MPRKPRCIQGNHIYHVLNRSNARLTIFHTPDDYAVFERTLLQAHERYPIRILAYVLMPNHFHLVLWPKRGQEQMLSDFMRWLQLTHTQRHHAHHAHHAHHHTSGEWGGGHLYQGRFKTLPVQGDHHLRTLCRYVERNPLRAKLVKRAEHWPFSSLYRRIRDSDEDRQLLADFPSTAPFSLPRWLDRINTPQPERELAALRHSIQRGAPFGSPDWIARTAKSQNLQHTLRPRGRPKKTRPKKDS